MSEIIYSIKHISKHFGKRLIIDDASFDFWGGKIYAILGKSGSGKTTLLNILGLLDNQYEGDKFINQKLIDNRHDHYEIRNRKIGFVFQSYYLIDYLDVMANVIMPAEYATGKVDENYLSSLLQKLNLIDLANEKVNYLSGGEKQRVAIARALINNPQIIICDEPTGNLDPMNAGQVITMLKQFITAEKTIIIVTHDEKVAASCNQIIRLNGGKLYAEN